MSLSEPRPDEREKVTTVFPCSLSFTCNQAQRMQCTTAACTLETEGKGPLSNAPLYGRASRYGHVQSRKRAGDRLKMRTYMQCSTCAARQRRFSTLCIIMYSVFASTKCRRVLCVGFGSALQNDRAPSHEKETAR